MRLPNAEIQRTMFIQIVQETALSFQFCIVQSLSTRAGFPYGFLPTATPGPCRCLYAVTFNSAYLLPPALVAESHQSGTILTVSLPAMNGPPAILPVRRAEVDVATSSRSSALKCSSRSISPSLSTSSSTTCSWPCFPREATDAPASLTVAGSTVVASKSSVVSIATGTSPLLPRLIGFGSLPGLMSISTSSVGGSSAERGNGARSRNTA